MIVYKATNKINGKCYIGQTTRTLQDRIWEHNKPSGTRSHFDNSVKKNGIENFKWTILEVCMDLDDLNEKEIWYINHFNSINNGYNITSGGRNFIRTDEIRKKMSDSNKGVKRTDETKRIISEAAKNRKISDERRLKTSNSMKGRIPWNKGLRKNKENKYV